MWSVYILKSNRKNKHYIGCTNNLNKRLKEHNTGRNKSTQRHTPWTIVYFEKFDNQEEAYEREKKIKSYKGGNAFKNLVKK